MDMEPDVEHRCPETSSSSMPPSSAEDDDDDARSDRLVETEIEAAETLADLAELAMREVTASDSVADGPQRVTNESPTPDSDLSHSAPLHGGQAVAGQQQDEKSATNKSIETKRIQQDNCSRHMEVEQDADSPKTISYPVVRCGRSRRNLTEEEKEARRIRRVLANRESARQTIRRRQALCEELTKKAAELELENENLKKEKERALEEYYSLESTNKHLKAQLAKSINTETEKTPVEQESSAAPVTTLPGNSPWFLYNHFPVTQIFWPPIIQSSNPVQVQHTPFNSIAIPSNVSVSVPCSSEPNPYPMQNNLVNDNRTQNPVYMVPYPWVVPLPEFRNGQAPPSIGLIDKQAELSLGKQCSSSSSLNAVLNADYQAALPITLKTEAPPGWLEARSTNDPGHITTIVPLDGADQKTGFHIFHGASFDGNGHASAMKQELQLHSAPNPEVSPTTSHAETSSVEKKQEKFMRPDKNLVGAVAAAEARKRRREITKLRSIQNRQSRMQC